MSALNKRKSRAFTLIEVLVSTAVLIMLAALLNQMMDSTIRVTGAGRKRMEVHSKARSALDLIARDVALGVYRPDVPAFENSGASPPAIALFTKRGASADPGEAPTESRNLSYVVYVAEKDINAPTFTLWRGAINVQWTGKRTYPPIDDLTDGPMPFSNLTRTLAFTNATDKTSGAFEPVLDGVARMEVRFLGSDGQYRKTYNGDAGSGPLSKALVVTLLVMDERTQDLIRSTAGVNVGFFTRFIDPGFALGNVDDDSTVSVGSVWNTKLENPANWTALPPGMRQGISVFERAVPIR